MADSVLEELSEEQCLNLIAGGGIGRIAYTGRFGPAVLPVNYVLHGGMVVFRVAEHGPLDDDLRTGIADADYKVAFEVDALDAAARAGWSVLIQGPAHHLGRAEVDAVLRARLESWAPGDRELFIRIAPSRITGRCVGPR